MPRADVTEIPEVLQCPFCFLKMSRTLPNGRPRKGESEKDRNKRLNDQPSWRCDSCEIRIVVTNPKRIRTAPYLWDRLFRIRDKRRAHVKRYEREKKAATRERRRKRREERARIEAENLALANKASGIEPPIHPENP